MLQYLGTHCLEQDGQPERAVLVAYGQHVVGQGPSPLALVVRHPPALPPLCSVVQLHLWKIKLRGGRALTQILLVLEQVTQFSFLSSSHAVDLLSDMDTELACEWVSDFLAAQEAFNSGVSAGRAQGYETGWCQWCKSCDELGIDLVSKEIKNKVEKLHLFAVQLHSECLRPTAIPSSLNWLKITYGALHRRSRDWAAPTCT